MPAPVLYIVRGLPGAGKTTRAEIIVQEIGCVMYAADDYMIENGVYKFDGSKLAAAHAACQFNTRAALMLGQSVVAHNTFTQGWEATPYVRIAEEAGAIIEVIDIFDGGLDDAALAVRNVHGVPLAGIAAMRARWDRDLLAAQAAEPRAPWERG